MFVANTTTPKLLSTALEKVKQLRLDAPLVTKLNRSAPTPAPKQAPPLHPERDVRRQQSERKDYRLFYETLAYVANTSAYNTITNLTAEPVCLHCSHHDLNVSIHDGIVYVRPSH